MANNNKSQDKQKEVLRQQADRARQVWMNMPPRERAKRMPGGQGEKPATKGQHCGHEAEPGKDPKCRDYIQKKSGNR